MLGKKLYRKKEEYLKYSPKLTDSIKYRVESAISELRKGVDFCMYMWIFVWVCKNVNKDFIQLLDRSL